MEEFEDAADFLPDWYFEGDGFDYDWDDYSIDWFDELGNYSDYFEYDYDKWIQQIEKWFGDLDDHDHDDSVAEGSNGNKTETNKPKEFPGAHLIPKNVKCATKLSSKTAAARRLRAKPEARIVGGGLAQANTWSWYVRLDIQLTDGIATCGATIIGDKYLLTAAHCIENIEPSYIKAYINDHKMNQKV